eukprot:gene11644-biopygen12427
MRVGCGGTYSAFPVHSRQMQGWSPLFPESLVHLHPIIKFPDTSLSLSVAPLLSGMQADLRRQWPAGTPTFPKGACAQQTGYCVASMGGGNPSEFNASDDPIQ